VLPEAPPDHSTISRTRRLIDVETHEAVFTWMLKRAVDLETGAIVGVTVQDADEGDTTTSRETLIEAAEQIEAVRPDSDGLAEVVGDKGYHSNQSLVDSEAVGLRSYISEPDRGRRNWQKHSDARAAVYRNRRRIRGARGQRLLRLRGERLERPFAHLYETGRMRRVHLRGHTNIRKRRLIHTAGFNLGLLMRQLIGVGTPRGLQGRLIAAPLGVIKATTA
jgi:Transposase DDE domain